MCNALENAIIQSHIIFSLATAKAVGLTELNGHVGHHGTHGCQLGCSIKGWHKLHTGHYFVVHLKPNNYTIQNCKHPDIDIHNLDTLSPDKCPLATWKYQFDSFMSIKLCTKPQPSHVAPQNDECLHYP